MKGGSINNSNWLMDYLKGNPLQVTLQVIGLGVLGLNLWLASQLSPLVSDIRAITDRVSALEKTEDSRVQDHADIQVIKTKVDNIDSIIRTVQEDIKFLIRQ